MENTKQTPEQLENLAKTNYYQFINFADVYRRNEPEYYKNVVEPIYEKYLYKKDKIMSSDNQSFEKNKFLFYMSFIYYIQAGILIIIGIYILIQGLGISSFDRSMQTTKVIYIGISFFLIIFGSLECIVKAEVIKLINSIYEKIMNLKGIA